MFQLRLNCKIFCVLSLNLHVCTFIVKLSTHVRYNKCCKHFQCLCKILCKKLGGAYANYFGICMCDAISDVTDVMQCDWLQ